MGSSKTGRRLLLLVLVIVALAAGLFWRQGAARGAGAKVTAVPAEDSTTVAAWRKANPWLFSHPEYEAFRESLILPFARENDLAPRSLRKRGAVVEMVFPSGRPIHEIAYALESLCAQKGLTVAEGREISHDQVEYLLKDARGQALTLRLALGQAALPGAVRMALVITGLGDASAADIAAWLKFPEAVTLVFPDTHAVLARGEPRAPGREIFIELPMEPAAYPYVKPGPRALFIDNSREQAEGVLRARLDAYPAARGFATTHGDRAIENPRLMESVLDFMASRSLVFLDLTGSPLSQTAALSVKSGAESFSSRVQEPGSEKNLEAELERRSGLAKKSGEGIWVLRHAPGLPGTLSRLLRRQSGTFEALGLEWVTLGELRREEK